MDLVDSGMYDVVFSNALAMFHDLYDDCKRNQKFQMDSGFICRSNGGWNAGLFFGRWNSSHTGMGIKHNE